MSAPPNQRPNQQQLTPQQQQQLMQQRQQALQQKQHFENLCKKQQSGQQLTPQEMNYCQQYQAFMKAQYQQHQRRQNQGPPGQQRPPPQQQPNLQPSPQHQQIPPQQHQPGPGQPPNLNRPPPNQMRPQGVYPNQANRTSQILPPPNQRPPPQNLPNSRNSYHPPMQQMHPQQMNQNQQPNQGQPPAGNPPPSPNNQPPKPQPKPIPQTQPLAKPPTATQPKLAQQTTPSQPQQTPPKPNPNTKASPLPSRPPQPPSQQSQQAPIPPAQQPPTPPAQQPPVPPAKQPPVPPAQHPLPTDSPKQPQSKQTDAFDQLTKDDSNELSIDDPLEPHVALPNNKCSLYSGSMPTNPNMKRAQTISNARPPNFEENLKLNENSPLNQTEPNARSEDQAITRPRGMSFSQSQPNMKILAQQNERSTFDIYVNLPSYDGSDGSGPIDSIISEVHKRNVPSRQMQEILIEKLQKGGHYDPDQARTALEKDLNLLNDSIASMSKICLKRLDAIGNKLSQMESEVESTDGYISAIKETAGLKLMSALANSSKKSEFQRHAQQFSQGDMAPKIEFPGGGFKINTQCLDLVGNQIADDIDISNPLIIQYNIYSGERPKPWGLRGDFFKSLFGTPEPTSFD